MQLQNISHVIWDWNGTLLNDVAYSVSVVNQLLTERSLPLVTVERYRELYTHPVEKMYRAFGFDLDNEDWPALCDDWHVRYCKDVRLQVLHADARATLLDFKSRGYIQSVLSALPHTILIDSIHHNQLSHFFHTISGLGDALGISKIDNGHALLKKLEANAQNTLVIGDSTRDAEVARALGAHCILVERGLESRERLLRNNVPVVANFDEVVALVAG